MSDALTMASSVRAAAAETPAARGLPTLQAGQGGLSTGLKTGRAALEAMLEAIERAGLTLGQDVVVAIDVAVCALRDAEKGSYHPAREGRHPDTAELIEMAVGWAVGFPIASIEGALDEEDRSGWNAGVTVNSCGSAGSFMPPGVVGVR